MRDDPLDTLLMLEEVSDGDKDTSDGRHQRAVQRDLAALCDAINGPEPRGKRFFSRLLSAHSHPIRLRDDVRAEMENAARSLWSVKFENKGYIERGLLQHLAFTASARSLPFFREAIDFSRPRDTLIPARQRCAIAGIAFVEAKTGSREAAAALDELLSHRDGRVRLWTVYAIAMVRRNAEGALDPLAASLLSRVAQEDRDLGPRCLARSYLAAFGVPLPDEPSRLCTLKVSYGARVWRSIEVMSDQTLDDLAGAVVHAVEWDDDHLYQFVFGKDHPHLCWPLDGEDRTGVDAPRVGDVGLLPRHRFEMIYDFGDMNRFGIEVIDVRDAARTNARYPRVVASGGEAPEQYARG